MAGCDKKAPETAPSTAPSTAAGAPSASAGPQAPAMRVVQLPDGCYNGLDLDEPSPAELVGELASRCAPASEPLFDTPKLVKLTPGATAPVPIQIESPARCFRVIAAARPGASLHVVVRAPDGVVLDRDAIDAQIAVLGPVCPRTAGLHRAELSGAGTPDLAAVQVMRAR
jgi:hypothetical protein